MDIEKHLTIIKILNGQLNSAKQEIQLKVRDVASRYTAANVELGNGLPHLVQICKSLDEDEWSIDEHFNNIDIQHYDHSYSDLETLSIPLRFFLDEKELIALEKAAEVEKERKERRRKAVEMDKERAEYERLKSLFEP